MAVFLSFQSGISALNVGSSRIDKEGSDNGPLPARSLVNTISRLHPEKLIGPGAIGCSQNPSLSEKTYPVKELQEDFFQFRRHIEETHPCPYAFTGKASFDRLFDAAYGKIEKPMSLREFYCLLAPLKAQIGCGHSHLDYPAEYRRTVQTQKFPLILRFYGNRCFLEKNLIQDSSLPRFCEILSINGIGIGDIADTLRSEIAADGHNRYFKASALENCFQYYYANHYGTPQEYSIRFSARDREEIRDILIPAVPCSGINFSNREFKDLAFQVFPDRNTALLTIDSFSYYREKNKIFFSYIDKAFSRIREENIGRVIIDLRGNGGGDPFCASYLWAHLEREPLPYFIERYGKYSDLAEPIEPAENRFAGELFVLIDGSNFSTTGHFCSLLKYHGRSVFVGTETGGTYTCNAAVKVFPLENTGLRLKIATGSFAAAVKGLPKNRGIIPQYPIETSLEDWIDGRDAVLDWTLRRIDSQKEPERVETLSGIPEDGGY